MGRPWTRDTVTAVLAELDGFATPMSDHRGSAGYRRRMIGRLLEKLAFETGAGA